MHPRIFIGGTGRSGTSIVYKALGCHEKIHSFPREMRFLVDPDGLVTLVDSLSTRYSPIIAREALFRFERLMRIYLTDPRHTPYRGFDLPAWLGHDNYWQRLDDFCESVAEVEYRGVAWQVERNGDGRLVEWARTLQGMRRRLQGRPSPSATSAGEQLDRERLKSARYFRGRAPLVQATARFVDDLFFHAAQLHGKETWCEKTPQNIFHLKFLTELFPDSAIIHIKRDPRAVVHSMTKQSWNRSPNDVHDVCLMLRNLYRRWLDLRDELDTEQTPYFELKIEEIAAAPEEQLGQLVSAIGIEGAFHDLPAITLERVNYWRDTMPQEAQNVANELLGPYIEAMGYER
ncbi:MAG TPA: sulfotransferase [Candidatus Sulfomarinibacteraceae bacterium]|nr:sulfotransferase [Candidatus Sulfomarinibacteraceae bacterium]